MDTRSDTTNLEKKGDKGDAATTYVYCNEEEVDAFEELKGREEYTEFRTLGWYQASALLLAETLALGVLSFPNLASNIGIVPTILATIGLAILAYFTGAILVDLKCAHPSVMSFADAGMVVGGPIFKWALFVGIMVNAVFVAASHVNSGGTAFVQMSNNARCSVLLGFCMALLGFLVSKRRH